MIGRGVAEVHVLGHILGGEDDGVVTAQSSCGHAAAVDPGHGPEFSVADDVTVTGFQLPVVRPSGDLTPAKPSHNAAVFRSGEPNGTHGNQRIRADTRRYDRVV